MNTAPVVSAIIIFYNAERFLAEAVDSVLAQTYRPWELLLVDDGSSDRSTGIARQYAAQRPQQIRYLRHPNHENRGMAASRNLGIANARGQYVGFLDADDVWLAAKLDEQVGILDKHPRADMVYGRTKIWYGWTQDAWDRARDNFYDLGVSPDRLHEPPTLFRVLLTNRYQTPTTCNALIRRTAFAHVGGFEESFRGMFEDQTFFAKLLLERPAYVSGTCWAFYRQHPDSCSERAAESYPRNRLAFLHWLAGYVDHKQLYDATLQRAIRFEIWRASYPRLASLAAWLSVPWAMFRAAIGGRKNDK